MDGVKARRYVFHTLGKDRNVSLLQSETGKCFVRHRGKIVEASTDFLGSSVALLTVGNERYLFYLEKLPDGLRLIQQGDLCCIKRQSGKSPTLFPDLTGQTKMVLKSQMPGLITALNVKENQYVKEGQILLVIEAMKMQNPLKTPASGKVKKLFVSVGMSVEGGIPLAEIERIKP